jgi:hypothetical protein
MSKHWKQIGSYTKVNGQTIIGDFVKKRGKGYSVRATIVTMHPRNLEISASVHSVRQGEEMMELNL